MKRLATPAWLLRHVVMIALVVTFLKLGWWQLSRAEGGNGLSIGYSLEWPAFAAFVVIVWLREVRLTLRPGATDAIGATEAGVTAGAGGAADAAGRRGKGMASPAVPETPGISAFDLTGARAARAARTEQAEMASVAGSDYNLYLAWLAAHPEAKPSDYRRAMNEGASAHE
jgi:hypothetical protein